MKLWCFLILAGFVFATDCAFAVEAEERWEKNFQSIRRNPGKKTVDEAIAICVNTNRHMPDLDKFLPLDTWIYLIDELYFNSWTQADRLKFLTRVYPLTDAGFTLTLLESAERRKLLEQWERYVISLPDSEFQPKSRNGIRDLIGMGLAQVYFQDELNIGKDGNYDLILTDKRSGGQTIFHTRLPKTEALRTLKINRGCMIISCKSNKTLLCFRFDPVYHCWFECGIPQQEQNATAKAMTTRETRGPAEEICFQSLRSDGLQIHCYGTCLYSGAQQKNILEPTDVYNTLTRVEIADSSGKIIQTIHMDPNDKSIVRESNCLHELADVNFDGRPDLLLHAGCGSNHVRQVFLQSKNECRFVSNPKWSQCLSGSYRLYPEKREVHVGWHTGGFPSGSAAAFRVTPDGHPKAISSPSGDALFLAGELDRRGDDRKYLCTQACMTLNEWENNRTREKCYSLLKKEKDNPLSGEMLILESGESNYSTYFIGKKSVFEAVFTSADHKISFCRRTASPETFRLADELKKLLRQRLKKDKKDWTLQKDNQDFTPCVLTIRRPDGIEVCAELVLPALLRDEPVFDLIRRLRASLQNK